MILEPYPIITKYYRDHIKARKILIEHSESVAAKALRIAEALGMPHEDKVFIQEAALLHDIGIFLTHAPSIGCEGKLPYICHGYLGHDLLVGEGWPKHARVCERHTGTGLTIEDIIKQGLPLPHRSMMPVSLPEQIITYADKFFSKDPGQLWIEQPIDKVRKKLLLHGQEKLQTFDKWHEGFGE